MKSQILIFLLLFTSYSFGFSQTNEKEALIYGEVYSLKPKENIRFFLWNDVFEMSTKEEPKLDSIIPLNRASVYAGAISPNGRDFNLHISNDILPAWISFEDTLDGFSYGPYLLSPSDSIKIMFDQRKQLVNFGGPSKHSFEMASRLNSLIDQAWFENSNMIDFSAFSDIQPELLSKLSDNNKKFRREVIPILDRSERITKMNQNLALAKSNDFIQTAQYFRSRVSEAAFSTLMIEFYSQIYKKVFYGFYGYYFGDLTEKDPELIDSFSRFFEFMESEIDSLSAIYNPVFSPTYLKMQENRFLGKSMIESKSFFEISKLESNPLIREKILAGYFLQRNVIIKEGLGDFTKFLYEVNDPQLKERLQVWHLASTPGLQVPDYSFIDDSDNEVRISDFKGKIVLINFWLTGCSACKYFNQHHLKRIVDDYKSDSDVIVLSLSLDSKREIWLKSKKSDIYSPNEVIQLWTGYEGKSSDHPYLAYFNITSAPQLQLIDQEGRLFRLGISEKTYSSIKSEIESLKENFSSTIYP